MMSAPNRAHLQASDRLQLGNLARWTSHDLPERCQRLMVDGLYQLGLFHHLSGTD
jgi:hypothetical protein